MEKKLQDSIKEKDILQKKNEKLHDHVAKITRDLNLKHSETMQLHNRLDNQRSEIMSKKIQLEAKENELQTTIQLYKECGKKLHDTQVCICIAYSIHFNKLTQLIERKMRFLLE